MEGYMSNINFIVDEKKCIKCGLCAKDCIAKAIQLKEFPTIDENKCYKCQHCFAICPVGAISILDKNPNNSHTNKTLPKANELENLIKMRRSCRNFKQDNVKREQIEKLKDILNYIPTGCNYRGLHFSLVDSIDSMNEIRKDLQENLEKLVMDGCDKPMIMAQKDRILNKEDIILRNAPHMIVVSVDKNAPCKNYDPIIALSYFEIFAQSLGISTLWCGLAYWLIPYCQKTYNKLQIPNNYELSYVMLFGYPDVEYQRSIQPNEYKINII